MAPAESKKAKIAKRVIEVLEFFDEERPQATVMDIVRRFDRPQSSTSELLSSLVDLGVLYKDPCTRAYSPTPRAAMLGSAVQPRLVRDGRLMRLIDRLAAQTGLCVGVFGMVGLSVQVYGWRAGKHAAPADCAALRGGQQEHLSDSAVGWLLLSTIVKPRREAMLRRLNAEAGADRKFVYADMIQRVQHCREEESVAGPVGFAAGASTVAVLLPGMPEQQPLAIGYVYQAGQQIDAAALTASLSDAVARHLEEAPVAAASVVQPLFDASRPAPLERMLG